MINYPAILSSAVNVRSESQILEGILKVLRVIGITGLHDRHDRSR